MRSSSHDSNEVCRLHCCHVKSLNKIETDFYSLMTCSLLIFFFFFFFLLFDTSTQIVSLSY